MSKHGLYSVMVVEARKCRSSPLEEVTFLRSVLNEIEEVQFLPPVLDIN